MAKYTVTFEVPLSLTVDVKADHEDDAGEKAWDIAEEYLRTVGGNYRDVRADATLDGIGADTIEPTQD